MPKFGQMILIYGFALKSTWMCPVPFFPYGKLILNREKKPPLNKYIK